MTEKYLLQVQKDYENLNPDLQRLEFAIASVEELNPSLSASWNAPVLSLGYSLAAGLLFMAIASFCIKRKEQ
ncbi:hypothetical protein [Laspinema olomoucense]|uniref:hypothetical protein n=1 Tax=Laspinema olomoucense TaxID=3231600 RepID=UPI0021BA4642|nr:hypothetical protein [Laspinema sp. D3c]MCT7997032.1 hypothetical protein [Laspinema sp. D3c]